MWWVLLALPAALALRHYEPPPPAPAPAARDDVTSGYVDVRLNHFQAYNTDTFPMRYYLNRLGGNSSDIVIFVGGEWAISPGWMQAGLAYELAAELGADLFYTEHRYYGLTRPTEEISVAELRYLTVDQALADLAQFIQRVRSDGFEGGKYKGGKVALVGCSYAGSMATWMRLAYPHLVTAALSDSGPLHAQEDFPEYLEVITRALREKGGESCLASVEAGMTQVVALLETADGPAQVSQLFNTCTPLQADSALDLATFFWFGVTETFAYLVQTATGTDVADACALLTDETLSSDPLQRLASWVTAQPWTQPCVEASYARVVAAHTNVSYDAPDSVMRLWTYQTCVEFGWYQTTSSDAQPFLKTVPLEYFHQMCKDFYSSLFDESFLRSGIERTNLFFAGLTHLPERVVSVAGALDPWAPMGPTEAHATPLSPVYVVPGESHCRAVQPTTSAASTANEALRRAQYAALHFLYAHMTGQTADNWQTASAGAAALPSVLAVAGAGAVLALLSSR